MAKLTAPLMLKMAFDQPAPARRRSFKRLAVGVGDIGADAGIAEGGGDLLDVGGVEVEYELVGAVQVEQRVCAEIEAFSASPWWR